MYKRKSYVSKRTRSAPKSTKRKYSGSRADPHFAPSRVPVNSSELKFVDYAATQIPCKKAPTSAEIAYTSIIPQGGGANYRLGQRVKPLALHIRGYFYMNTLSTIDLNDILGYFLIHDKSPNLVLPDRVQMFNASENNLPFAFGDVSNAIMGNRFTIIKRFQTPLANPSGFSNYLNTVPIDHYIKIPSKCGITTYSRGIVDGSISTCVNGALYIVPFGNYDENFSWMSFGARLYFQDV